MKPVPDTSLEILCTAFEGLADGLASNIVDLFCNGQHMEAADMAETLSDIVAAAAKARTRTLSRRAAATASGYAAPTPTPPKEVAADKPTQDDLFPAEDPVSVKEGDTVDMWAGFKPEVEQRPGLCVALQGGADSAESVSVAGGPPPSRPDVPAATKPVLQDLYADIPDDEREQLFRVFGRPADAVQAPGAAQAAAAFESLGTMSVRIDDLATFAPPIMPQSILSNLPPIRSIADGPAQPLAKPGT